MGKPCVAKGPCNVHVNLTGIAGKPQICAKIEGKYEINFRVVVGQNWVRFGPRSY